MAWPPAPASAPPAEPLENVAVEHGVERGLHDGGAGCQPVQAPRHRRRQPPRQAAEELAGRQNHAARALPTEKVIGNARTFLSFSSANWANVANTINYLPIIRQHSPVQQRGDLDFADVNYLTRANPRQRLPGKRRRNQAKARGRHLRTLDKEASRAFVGPLEGASLPSRPPPRIARGGRELPGCLRPPRDASPSGALATKQSSCNKRQSLRASP